MGTASADIYYLEGDAKRFIFREGEAITADRLEQAGDVGDRLYMDVPLSDDWKQGLVIGALLVAGIGLFVLVKHTKIGKAMRALSSNAETARLPGSGPEPGHRLHIPGGRPPRRGGGCCGGCVWPG